MPNCRFCNDHCAVSKRTIFRRGKSKAEEIQWCSSCGDKEGLIIVVDKPGITTPNQLFDAIERAMGRL